MNDVGIQVANRAGFQTAEASKRKPVTPQRPLWPFTVRERKPMASLEGCKPAKDFIT